MRSPRRVFLAALALSISVVVLAACGQAQAEDAADPAARWPFSVLTLPEPDAATDSLGREVSDSTAAAQDDEGVGTEDGAGSEAGDGERLGGGREQPRLGMGSDAVDMEQSGPLIHTRPVTDFIDARFPRPRHVRGLYVNAWAAGSSTRMTALIDLARRTEINTFVIDIKDATGYLSHATEVPLAHEIGATAEPRMRDLPALLDRLEAEGIYPVARIVVVKDPILATFRPEFAIQDTAGGVWVDSKGIVWLNAYQRGVWEYNVQIAREVAELGFPEIQWDYIRFPDAPETDMARAVFPGADGRTRTDAIRGFLTFARNSLADLPVRSTADVFGVTTSYRRDIGLGQLWETFIDVVDVALPMVYPSHYGEGSFGFADPNAHPYEVVRAALDDAVERSARVAGAGRTRPWIQDFTLGSPLYGAAEVRAQIQAAYDVGIEEWVLWNPGSRYTEAALEPVDGFVEEPLVRVGGVLTPASRRQAVLDSLAAFPVDSGPVMTPAPDSIVIDTAAVDTTTVVDTTAVDTTAVIDTTAVDTTAVIDTTAVGPTAPFSRRR